MGIIRNYALGILAISALTFIALFGRLPALRRTPIGFLHRAIWIYIPNFFIRLDGRLTGGRFVGSVHRVGNYLVYERHPIVLIAFIALLTSSIAIFLHETWSTLSKTHRTLTLTLTPLPYLFTYLCRASRSSHITPTTHALHMRRYPYDRILYHPGHRCRTCLLLKPARSKHCGACDVCVARMDHHCVWVDNCLGRDNYRHFLLLLVSLTLLLSYGAYLAYAVLAPQVPGHPVARTNPHLLPLRHSALPKHLRYAPSSGSFFGALKRWSARELAFVAMAADIGGISVAGVGLLAFFTAPLPFGMLVYHVYLIWSGMTTNESGKWADLRDDMRDGVVFMGRLVGRPSTGSVVPPGGGGENGYGTTAQESRYSFEGPTRNSKIGVGARAHVQEDEAEPATDWPVESRQILFRLEDGQSAERLPPDLDRLVEKGSWRQCWKLAEVENIYDLGFWENLVEMFHGL